MIADDFVGQVSVIDGDTLDIHGPISGSGASMHRRAASYAEAKTVRNFAVARRQRTTSTRSSPGVRLTARAQP
jgi:hypothetical protein